MRTASLAILAVLLAGPAFAQPNLQWVKSPQLVAEKDGSSWWASFELSRPIDVEVAIVDPKTTRVVRHLAAGLLGSNPPPPLVANSLSQKIAWDGKDDYGRLVSKNAKWVVRVRAGMSAKLDRIVGGDPYAYWSEWSGQGDHAQWMVTGLEAKSDGKVYVLGNTTFYGGPTIRQYNARGVYRRTVFPPPAGKPVEDVAGWGINTRGDGSFTLQSRSGWGQATPSKTLISRGGQGLCASLVPTLDPETLCLTSVAGRDFGNQFMTIGCDGTLRQLRLGALLAGEPLPRNGLSGNVFSACAPDGKSLYISGLFAGGDNNGVATTGFWRDGQVWKVDLTTRQTQRFFSLPEAEVIGPMKQRGTSPIGHTSANPYAAFHGVATDAEGRVFVCDRQNKRVVVLDQVGQRIRELPVAYPDAVVANPNAKSKTLYVTTRFGDYGGNGALKLLKFNDWSKDDAPALTVNLRNGIGKFRENSLLAIAEENGEHFIWVAYTTLPVRVYRDAGASLELVQDFYAAGPQRALDLQHIEVDRKTENVYVADAQGFCFRVTDWERPKFDLCQQDPKTPLRASSLAIDAENRQLFTHYQWGTPVYRWKMEGEYFSPAPAGVIPSDSVVTIPGRPVPAVGFAHAVTPPIACSWIFTGLGERGIAVAPGGGLATLGVLPDKDNRADDYSGPLHFFKPDAAHAPWKPLRFLAFGKQPRSGGIRFDKQGNLYVGLFDGTVRNVPSGFEKDPDFKATTGRIYKYAPTGSLATGNLFPTEPAEPAKVYDIHYGPLGPQSRTPRFGVDGFGRIYYPTGQLPQVSVIDNEGNPILAFGTYGNRDSLGGLPGELVKTTDIPLAWPNSVDATDDYIYVSDIINVRLLRIAKTFALHMSSPP